MDPDTSYSATIPHGIMFHHLHNGQHPKVQGSMCQREFEEILKFVGLDRFLSPDEWLAKVEKGKLTAGDLCVTLDDALLCQYDIALPVLERLGIKAFWFVYSSVFEGHLEKIEIYRFFRNRFFENIEEFYELFFEKVLASEYAAAVKKAVIPSEIERILQAFPFYSINDIRFRLIRDRALPYTDYQCLMDEMIRERRVTLKDLSKDLWMNNEHLQYLTEGGHVVGLHSYSHPTTLGQLPYESQFDEYVRNYRHIQAVCGRKPVAAAHPANSYNDYTVRILTELGVCCAFRSNMIPPREDARLNPNHLELAREDHANIFWMMGKRMRSGVPANQIHGGKGLI